MNLFEVVKANINTQEVAQTYGIDVNHHGMALCPFHNDRHPSLYVSDDHYHCFACGEHGDVIDLTAKLFDLRLYTKQPWRLWAVSSTSSLLSCTLMSATGLCRKLWGRMYTTTTFMWCMSRWWRNRFSGRSGARISPLWVQSRKRSCRSAGAKSGNPR